MILPYAADVPMERWPYANWILVGLTTLVSFLAFSDVALLPDLALPRAEPSPLAFVTYALVHGGFWHVLGNMVFLFVFGNAVNAKLGHAAYVAFYVACAAVAGVAWTLLGGGDFVVGASGAISGVVGLFFVLYPRNRISLLVWFIVPRTFHPAAGWLIAAYVAFDVWGLLASESMGGGVAHSAHLAGAALGILAGVVAAGAGWAAPGRGEENLLQVLGAAPPPPRREVGRLGWPRMPAALARAEALGERPGWRSARRRARSAS